MSVDLTLGGELKLNEVLTYLQEGGRVQLHPGAREAMDRSRAMVASAVEEGRVVYGITTGFGKFSSVTIQKDDLEALQLNLIRSHACGVGRYLPGHLARTIVMLRAHALAQGHSGVRPLLVETLIQLANLNCHPAIPAFGSVGASGDLAPLAHLALVLVGEGSLIADNEVCPSIELMQKAGISPLTLQPKEGLALINGTQVSTAMALDNLNMSRRLFSWSQAITALTLDAARGSDGPTFAPIHQIRRQSGQIQVASVLERLLRGSEIRHSHEQCPRVQDNYALRCAPQVHGAVLDTLHHVSDILGREINAVTDNPLIFPEEGRMVSGGNFHAEPVALVCDFAAVAMAELGSIAERRVETLVNPQLSFLPPFLVEKEGLESGMMIPQVVAASLVSANKSLAFPASVDSIPTSGGKEDHVSMAPHAAWKWRQILKRLAWILAIELLCAVKAVDFLRPLKSSEELEGVVAMVKDRVGEWKGDTALHSQIEEVADMLRTTPPDTLCKGISGLLFR
ncbi:MAG TPA: histidine ammonia-lyase [Thermoanaerobaculia bacterium]|nr:histidine ammonia-lyase [Thermoanaerobaculia bacterium]HUM29292.1 histidine ammonia-lyase [Thermoanaerobaculia bacterium]HXK67750.1 histidine ammonia-lyase [Thermoanaerobaculia bacterium]